MVRPLLVSTYFVDREMGSTMAAADKLFSSAFLTLVDTLGLLVGLIWVSNSSIEGSNACWYCLLKVLSDLGIIGYGFSPVKLPPDLDFFALFHGVDERIPVDGLRFGVKVLNEFLQNS